MTDNTRGAAQAALDAYRTAREHASNDAEDISDLIADLAHLADLSDDPDLTGSDVLLNAEVELDTPGEDVLSTAFENYRAEGRHPWALRD